MVCEIPLHSGKSKNPGLHLSHFLPVTASLQAHWPVLPSHTSLPLHPSTLQSHSRNRYLKSKPKYFTLYEVPLHSSRRPSPAR